MPGIHVSTYIRRGVLAAVVGFGLVVGGCGNDGAPPAEAAAPGGEGSVETTSAAANGGKKDPCALLSREEVEAVVGNPLADGKKSVVQCIWEPLDWTDSSLAHAAVSYLPVPPGTDPDEFCENGMLGLPGFEPYPGIGNSAYWDYHESPLATSGALHVCLDTAMIQAQVLGNRPEQETQQMVLTIINTVLSRV